MGKEKVLNLILLKEEFSITQYISRNGDLIRIYILQNGDKWGLFLQFYIYDDYDDNDHEEIDHINVQKISRFILTIHDSNRIDMKKDIKCWNFRTHFELCESIMNDFQKYESYLYDCIINNYGMKALSQLFVFVLLINDKLLSIKPTEDMLRIRKLGNNTAKYLAQKARKKLENAKRFFRILIALPDDLQMVMINRVYGISRNSIPSALIENGLHHLRVSGFFD
jgi:hypothetical protein